MTHYIYLKCPVQRMCDPVVLSPEEYNSQAARKVDHAKLGEPRDLQFSNTLTWRRHRCKREPRRTQFSAIGLSILDFGISCTHQNSIDNCAGPEINTSFTSLKSLFLALHAPCRPFKL